MNISYKSFIFIILYIKSYMTFNSTKNNTNLSIFSKLYTYFNNYILYYNKNPLIYIYDNEKDIIEFQYHKSYNRLDIEEVTRNMNGRKTYKTNNIDIFTSYLHTYINFKQPTLSLYSPHGMLTTFMILYGSIHNNLNNNNCNALVADVLGKIPLLNIIIANNSGVSISLLHKYMEQQKNIIIYAGGMYEQLYGLNDGELYYSTKLQLFDNALLYKYNIQPVYIFGENDVLERTEPTNIQNILLKNNRIALPLLKKTNNLKYLVIYGKLLNYNDYESKYTYFEAYKNEMKRIFNNYKTYYKNSYNNLELNFIPMDIKTKL